jgi:hypothetical protein
MLQHVYQLFIDQHTACVGLYLLLYIFKIVNMVCAKHFFQVKVCRVLGLPQEQKSVQNIAHFLECTLG